VLLTTEPSEAASEMVRRRGVAVESSEMRNRRILEGLGVPASVIVILPEVINSTADEARVFARYALREHLQSVMVVTSPAHTARARLTFIAALKQVIPDRSVKVLARAATLGAFHADNWWQSRATLREGFYEFEKLLYYRLVELR
jgi:uncharacterized SAM-binding protein YcdF (DUF218 family)